jgi:hypothetical protein
MVTKKLHFGGAKKGQTVSDDSSHTTKAADAEFYKGYDPLFLAKKAVVLYGIYKNILAFKECSKSWDVRADVEDGDLSSVLATELHNASFHQTEAMIALLLCEFQNRPDWVYLTTYGIADMKNAAKGLAAGDFATFSGDAARTAEAFVKLAVFADWALSDTNVSDTWRQSVSDIAWLVRYVAERFVSAHEYNAYKHGLRVVSGPAQLGVSSLSDPSALTPIINMPHGLTYLEIHDDAEG